MRLTSEFKFQALNFDIASFYKTKPIKVFSSLIVKKHYAFLETIGEDQQSENANHREICKFDSQDDETSKAGNQTEPNSQGIASQAEQGFSAVAERCKVDKTMDEFKGWLTHSAEDWLLIVDNADDPSLGVSQFFSAGNRGTLIITTRNPECRTHATVGFSEIGQLSREEGISLLTKASDEDETETSLLPQAQAVAETLGYLALAITHASAMSQHLEKISMGHEVSTGGNPNRILSHVPGHKGILTCIIFVFSSHNRES
ncbi:hypothetical protein OEA41_002558 [Lepraria neglecta]|uniref:NB-ARC domain-containing protein n=1 Tax=Lepraria neglecta TaxID=209136 RepID=A0AAD9ZBS3_9LECA|nr:hypothetical protein OEA41_002558 [Lepraria neglecta]